MPLNQFISWGIMPKPVLVYPPFWILHKKRNYIWFKCIKGGLSFNSLKSFITINLKGGGLTKAAKKIWMNALIGTRLLLNFKRILENIFFNLILREDNRDWEGKFSFLFDLKSNLNPAQTQDCIRFSNS